MKRLVLIALSLSLVLPRLASADDKDKKHNEGHHNQARNFAPRAQGRMNQQRVNAAQAHTSAAALQNPGLIRQGVKQQRALNHQRNFNQQENVLRQQNVARQQNLNQRVYTPQVNTENNVPHQNRWNNNRRNNNNGYGQTGVGQSNEIIRHNGGSGQHWDRDRHDRGWYRSHYSRFARFGGGYYYYNSGFWYPAYGYDPYFSTYSYDAPVYGYNDLDPGQVIANVQAQLQREGYYRGDLDGLFGPMTRRALLNFQANNGLEENGEIDESTLDALGLR